MKNRFLVPVALGALAACSELPTAVDGPAALQSGPVLAEAEVVDATDSGWYDDAGFHVPTNINYLVGNPKISPEFVDHHNFFVFDLSSISLTVTSAILQLNSGQILGVDNDPLYSVFDVSTPIAALTAGGSGLTAIFNDLGSGTLYGSRTYTAADGCLGSVPPCPDPTLDREIPLNDAAVAAINAALGSQFALGGALTGCISNRNGQCFLFGSTVNPGLTKRLLLTLAPAAPPTEEVLEDLGTALDDAEAILFALPDLKGTNGLVSKINEALDLVQQAVAGLQDGSLTLAEVTALLDDARDLLEAFKNQVQGKMNGRKPQIPAPEGAALLALADDALSFIDELEALLSP